MKGKTLTPEQMDLLLPELLEQTEAFPLTVTGYSMTPFLAHQRDTVWLSKVTSPLKRGDIVFYRRESGGWVLHRIIRCTGETYTLLGDAQTIPEPGVTREQIRAVVIRAARKGKTIIPGCFLWEFFAKAWPRMVPLRPLCCKLWALLPKPQNIEQEHNT